MDAIPMTLYNSTKTNIIYPQTKANLVFTNDNQNVEVVLQSKLTTPNGLQGQVLGYIDDNTVGAISISSSSIFNQSFSGILNSGAYSWSLSNGRYSQQINIEGITSTQSPLVIPQWTTNISNEKTSWSNLIDIESFDGYVLFYSTIPTTTNVNFIILYQE